MRALGARSTFARQPDSNPVRARRGWKNAQRFGTVRSLMTAVNPHASTKYLPGAAGMAAFTLIDQPRGH
jgi:hypothetical protein